MKLGIYEILHKVNLKSVKKERLEELQKHSDNETLKTLLKMAFDDGLQWRLPYGVPPYEPSPNMDQEGMLYAELRRFYLFARFNGQDDNVSQTKRELLWIRLLETLHPEDAKVISAIKDKNLSDRYPRITKKLIEEAWPNLLQ